MLKDETIVGNCLQRKMWKNRRRTRETVHRLGLWQQTFHCWFYSFEEDELILYFQRRLAAKKDFPNLLDITAAGHLTTVETVFDGFREVQEELGIQLTEKEAKFLGVIPLEIQIGDFIDKEFTNVFIVESDLLRQSFFLQEEEVADIYPIALKEMQKLYNGTVQKTVLTGIIQKNGYQH